MKKILTTDELITHMKEKGITFNKVSEEAAREFLSHHNYYLKLSAYRFNYSKYGSGHEREGEYQGLDFGYLKELSTIDMHLRYQIMEMCLDIEHAIKVRLIDTVSQNPNEDGYNIVKLYLKKEDPQFKILRNIQSHKSGEYCKDLIDKYYPFFPIWVLVELISFGDLIHLCAFYDKKYNTEILLKNKFLNTIRDLRNAVAHSNCLMNKMTEQMEDSKQPDSILTTYIKNISSISKSRRTKYMNRTFSYNIVTLLYVYDHYVPLTAKKKRYEKLSEFMHNRVVRHKDYFFNNGKICGLYNFLVDVIDNLSSKE